MSPTGREFGEEKGDNVHLEITVEDPDTDVVSVMIDFHGEGWGILEFSDSGLSGDLVVHDDIWTAQTNSTGLFFGTMEATIYVQDIWATVSENVMLNITNPGPRVVEADRAPNRLSRGEEFSVSIIAYDMHGISTVSIDLQPYGGDKVMLELNENTWSGSALMPDGVSPGGGLPCVLGRLIRSKNDLHWRFGQRYIIQCTE